MYVRGVYYIEMNTRSLRLHGVRKRRDAGSDDFEGLLEFQEALYVGWKLFLDGRGKFGGIYVGRMGFR